uniref:NADH:ubiquinone reductase (H(+)-translocating) n=1 Tax=Parasagitta elegans TaxID=1562708 RepID=A0A141CLJ0_9BILA|nr:NADH dehydrogenase subunit 5 [Parasagitta elegans]
MVALYMLVAMFCVLCLSDTSCGLVFQSLGVFPISLTMDCYSSAFLLLLLLISSQVLLWSYYYMDAELYYRRFVSLLFAFLGSMFMLVFFSSLYGAFIGWDGLGITSFLLVIYFKNRKSLSGGSITALMNRMGDCFFLVCLAAHYAQISSAYLLTACLILTSMTKSAQYPFSSWLPAAMAAPTPVSALVHSSTLVTAGVYLLIRFNSMGTEWLLMIGSVTLCMAGMCACAEMDLKKVVALSTLSQLGVMMVALSVHLKSLCFFHLTTHAMFKAMLFICVGMGIHSVYGTQDFRSFCGFGSVASLPSLCLTIANISLAGLPFMSGFYSKDAILESFYNSESSFLFMLVFLSGVGLTTAYSVKMTFLAIVSGAGGGTSDLGGGGTSWVSKVPLLVLSWGAVCAGGFLANKYVYATVVMGWSDKVLPLCVIGLGIMIGTMLSQLKFIFLSHLWFLTPSAQLWANSAVLMGGAGDLDRGVVALVAPSGVGTMVVTLAKSVWWLMMVAAFLCSSML